MFESRISAQKKFLFVQICNPNTCVTIPIVDTHTVYGCGRNNRSTIQLIRTRIDCPSARHPAKRCAPRRLNRSAANPSAGQTTRIHNTRAFDLSGRYGFVDGIDHHRSRQCSHLCLQHGNISRNCGYLPLLCIYIVVGEIKIVFGSGNIVFILGNIAFVLGNITRILRNVCFGSGNIGGMLIDSRNNGIIDLIRQNINLGRVARRVSTRITNLRLNGS